MTSNRAGRPPGRGRRFGAFLLTQFLGALNDNILKQFLTLQAVLGVWRQEPGAGKGAAAPIFLLFTLPFLLFSSFGGQFADRFSKRSMAISLKGVEIAVMLIALLAVANGWYGLTLGCLVLMASQSAFFGPAKYGLIPEIVAAAELSRANGAVNMTTNVAVIGGTLAGGLLSDGYTAPTALPGLVLVAVAVAGFLAALRIARVPAQEPALRLRAGLLRPIVSSLAEMARDRVLLRVGFAWAFFYFLGVTVMASIPDFAELLYGKAGAAGRHVEVTYLLTGLLIGIGVSSVAAGLLSGDRIRTGLVVPGILAVTVFLLAFPFLPGVFGWTLVGTAGLGLSAGFYIIPLQALLQSRAGASSRGRILGTTNFVSFLFMAVGAVIYGFLARGLDLAADWILFANGCVALAMAVVLARWRRRGLLEA